MQIGQTYKIPVTYEKSSFSEENEGVRDKTRIINGVLVQITPYLYVFDYKDRQKNIIRTCIRKVDYHRLVKKWGKVID